MSIDSNPSAAELGRRAANSLVKVRGGAAQAVGFLFSAEGHIATCLHAVVGGGKLAVTLADGSEVLEIEVLGTDPRRDLAILRLLGGRPTNHLALAEPGELGAGDRVISAAPSGGADNRVVAERELGAGLVLAELAGLVSEDEAGAPLLNGRGEVVGMALAAQRDDEPVTLGVPAACLKPYLGLSRGKPAAELRSTVAIKRQVPKHALGILDGCALDGLERLVAGITSAIEVGAPAYNRGDIAACYREYRETTQRLIQAHPECPGAVQALREGLERAEALGDVDEQAWAMRDTFDGLLSVIERWFTVQAELAPSLDAKKGYLN